MFVGVCVCVSVVLSPGSFPAFQCYALKCGTLKSRRAWGRDYVSTIIIIMYMYTSVGEISSLKFHVIIFVVFMIVIYL